MPQCGVRSRGPTLGRDDAIGSLSASQGLQSAASPTRLLPRAPLQAAVANQELRSKVPSKSANAKKPASIDATADEPGALVAEDTGLAESSAADAGQPVQTEAEAPPPSPHVAAPVTITAPPPEPDVANDVATPKPVLPAPPQAGFAPPAVHRPTVPPQPGVPRPPGGIPGRVTPPPRPMAKAEQFAEGDYVVYPTHGVGKVERIAIEEIAGHKLELIHITFEENRMTLRVPVSKARTAGLRKLASRKLFDDAMGVLKGRARIKRTMWSRRAQEYEAKINSGDPLAIAEVVRDLHRNAGQPDQSFSERQIYEAAMDRLAAELAALDRIDKAAASVKLVEFLKTV